MNGAIKRPAVWLEYFVYVAALTAALVAANIESITTEGHLLLWICLGLCAALAAIGSSFAAGSIATRAGMSRSTQVVVAAIATGVGYAFVDVIGTASLDLNSDRAWQLRAVSDVLVLSVFSYAVLRIKFDRRQVEARRAQLIEEAVAIEFGRMRSEALVDRLRTMLQSEVDTVLVESRRDLDRRLTRCQGEFGREHWPDIADQLRMTAEGTVRPLSKRLWKSVSRPSQPSRLWWPIAETIQTQPFRPIALSMVYVASTIAQAVTTLGWLYGLGVIGTGVGIIFGVLSPVNWLMSKFPRFHGAMFIGGTVALQLFTLLAFPLRQGTVTPYSWEEFALSVVFSFGLILTTSAYGTIQKREERVEGAVRLEIEKELVDSVAENRLVAQLTREAARDLHGSVQTRLIACAVAIEQATQTNDAEAFADAVGEAMAILVQPLALLHPGESVSMREEILRKISLWEGLCDISVDFDPQFDDGQHAGSRDVGRIVEEAITNAIRHGDAQRVSIFVHVVGDDVEIRVSDDGRELREGSPGLGTALLDSLAPGNWSLSRSDQKTTLTVLLPAPSEARVL